jgi:hypothetical protein
VYSLLGDDLLEASILLIQLPQALHGVHVRAAVALLQRWKVASLISPILWQPPSRGSRSEFGLGLAQLADDLLWGMAVVFHQESSFFPLRAAGLSW